MSYFPSSARAVLLKALLSIFPITICAQEFNHSPDLTINFDEPNWVFNVSTQVLEEREPRLDPNESLLGDAIRPLLNQGDYQGVAAVMEEAMADGVELSPALQHILGQVYMTQQNYDKAEEAFLKATVAMPSFARAHQRLGLLYLQDKQYDKARTHLSLTISLGVSDAETYGQLAFANLQDYSPWSAVNGYQQALLLEPGNSQWQQGLLFSLVSARNFSAAQALIDEMLAKDRDNRDLWLQSGNIALNNNDPLSALTRLELALKLEDTDPANQVITAQLHLKHGSIKRAVDLLLASLNSSTEYYDTIEETIAWLIYNQHWQETERLISAGLDSWTNLSSAQESSLLAHRGALALAQDDIEKAATHLSEAIELNPANGAALLSLADLRSNQQVYVQAALLYVRAASIDTYAERALLGHAQLTIDQRDFRQAVDLLNKVLTLNPTRQDIRNNIQTLNRIILNEG